MSDYLEELLFDWEAVEKNDHECKVLIRAKLKCEADTRQQKFRAMNGAIWQAQLGESLVMLNGPIWAPKFIALLETKFGAH